MKFIVGNWKMNGTPESRDALLKSIRNVITDNKIVVCLPFILICGNDFGVTLGAQDISEHDNGAYTGDISGQMLNDANVKYVIVGHSERRTYHHETNEIVRAKATAAIKNKIVPIICVGESTEEKNSGRTMTAVKKMLLESIPSIGEFIVAYEPYWAIGSGKTPSGSEIADVFETIRKALSNAGRDDVALLYGGSVNATNAKEIVNIKNVDGLLVGGASLKSDTFLPIIKSID